jgi:hypothetical protein
MVFQLSCTTLAIDLSKLSIMFFKSENLKMPFLKVKVLLVVWLLCFTCPMHAQDRYVIWFMPSKAEAIHGIAINSWFSSAHFNDDILINGAQVQISPIAVFPCIYNIAALAQGSYLQGYIEKCNNLSPGKSRKTINGVNITIADWGIHKLNGCEINLMSSEVIYVNGVSISGLHNKNKERHGLAIAGVSNLSAESRGVEIALFNNSRDFRGVQLGIWNINHKRSLPILNFAFSK